MLVARLCFEESHGKLQLCHVIQEATALGLSEIPKDKSFRSALAMFANEVVKGQLVELTKEGGLEKKEKVMDYCYIRLYCWCRYCSKLLL